MRGVLPTAVRHRRRVAHGWTGARGRAVSSSAGPRREGHRIYTLVHLPSAEIIATLRTSRQVRALASELAPTWLRDRDLAAGIVDRHARESV